MSVDLIKSISIDPMNQTVSVISACNNVTPRRYERWDPLANGSFSFDDWMQAFARDCFGGSSQFLPSCESKAHEAYLHACDEMGGDWTYAYRQFGFGDKHDLFCRRWCRIFIDFCLNGVRDRRKFVITRNGHPVSLSVRRSRYGGLSGRYRYVDNPKPVSWVRKSVCLRELEGFDAQVV